MTSTSQKVIFAVLSFLLLSAGIVKADQTAPNNDKMQEMHEKHLERMTKELSLSSDQQNQVKALLDDQSAKMKGVTAREDRKAIHDATDQKIVALLNDDQKAKFQKMQDERMKKMKDGKHMHQKSDSNQGQEGTTAPQTN